MSTAVQSLVPGRRIRGAATTCQIAEGDNLYLRRAVKRGPVEGPVLVVEGSPTASVAVMGGLIASALLNAGFIAVVTDALVRDSAELRLLSIDVWARGVSPKRSTKVGPGSLGTPVKCGAVPVRPGDIIVADDDGVVVWPADSVQRLLSKAEEKWRTDSASARRIAAGGVIGE